MGVGVEIIVGEWGEGVRGNVSGGQSEGGLI